MKTTERDFELEFYQDSLDVTSNHRPDPSWKFIDKAGHLHQWYDDSGPAITYSPIVNYHVPSVLWVKTGINYYDDGSPYETGERRCIVCGEIVSPGFTADTFDQYVVGGGFRISGSCLIEFSRGFELFSFREEISLLELLKDCKDFDTEKVQLSDDLKVSVSRIERDFNSSLSKVWFEGRGGNSKP